MALFRSKSARQEEDEELAEYAEWLSKVRETDSEGVQNLEQEIRNRSDLIKDAIRRKKLHPRSVRITEVRKDIETLRGMVVAWLFVSGKFDGVPDLSKVTNQFVMSWLDVDLENLAIMAAPQKRTPKNTPLP